MPNNDNLTTSHIKKDCDCGSNVARCKDFPSSTPLQRIYIHMYIFFMKIYTYNIEIA